MVVELLKKNQRIKDEHDLDSKVSQSLHYKQLEDQQEEDKV